jgi:predicted nucleic acid-binding protein
MQEESLGYIEGVLDVSIVVPTCFENPLKEESVSFLREVLTGRKKVLLPVSAVIGTYHIVTSYLGVSRVSAKKILGELLATNSESFYPQITPNLASIALDYASVYGIESWDGYLVGLARRFNAKAIFSLDEELRDKIKELVVVNPFSKDRVRRYHKFLTKLS